MDFSILDCLLTKTLTLLFLINLPYRNPEVIHIILLNVTSFGPTIRGREFNTTPKIFNSSSIKVFRFFNSTFVPQNSNMSRKDRMMKEIGLIVKLSTYNIKKKSQSIHETRIVKCIVIGSMMNKRIYDMDEHREKPAKNPNNALILKLN